MFWSRLVHPWRLHTCCNAYYSVGWRTCYCWGIVSAFQWGKFICASFSAGKRFTTRYNLITVTQPLSQLCSEILNISLPEETVNACLEKSLISTPLCQFILRGSEFWTAININMKSVIDKRSFLSSIFGMVEELRNLEPWADIYNIICKTYLEARAANGENVNNQQ